MVNPGGTGRPALVISARFAPLPPRRSRWFASPSRKRETQRVAVAATVSSFVGSSSARCPRVPAPVYRPVARHITWSANPGQASTPLLDPGERGHQLLHARADEGDGDLLIVAQVTDRDDRAITEAGVRDLVAGAEARAVGGRRVWLPGRLPAGRTHLRRRDGG